MWLSNFERYLLFLSSLRSLFIFVLLVAYCVGCSDDIPRVKISPTPALLICQYYSLWYASYIQAYFDFVVNCSIRSVIDWFHLTVTKISSVCASANCHGGIRPIDGGWGTWLRGVTTTLYSVYFPAFLSFANHMLELRL